jgi:hypothetical protein
MPYIACICWLIKASMSNSVHARIQCSFHACPIGRCQSWHHIHAQHTSLHAQIYFPCPWTGSLISWQPNRKTNYFMDGRFGGVGLARGSKTYWKSLFSHHLFLFDDIYIYIYRVYLLWVWFFLVRLWPPRHCYIYIYIYIYIWIMTHNCKPQLFSILFFRDFNLMI